MKKNLALLSLGMSILAFVNISYANSLNGQIKSKNGWFLGIEGSMSKFYAKTTFDLTNINSSNTNSNSGITFELGAIGGYQHYFGYLQKHGIKVSAHFQYGPKNNWDMSTTEGTSLTVTKFSYMAIKTSLDIKYIYDFYQQNNHTFGLNIGLGYGVDSYIKGNTSAKYTSDGLEHKNRNTLKNLFAQGVYPVVGLHYYYLNHQFEILYRGGGILDIKGHKQTTINNSTTLKQTLASNSYVAVNYTYRF